jgi:hypothetical protein
VRLLLIFLTADRFLEQVKQCAKIAKALALPMIGISSFADRATPSLFLNSIRIDFILMWIEFYFFFPKNIGKKGNY